MEMPMQRGVVAQGRSVEFLDWCVHVLRTFTAAANEHAAEFRGNVATERVARLLFDSESVAQQDFQSTSQFAAVFDALDELATVGLVEKTKGYVKWRPSPSTSTMLAEPSTYWRNPFSPVADRG